MYSNDRETQTICFCIHWNDISVPGWMSYDDGKTYDGEGERRQWVKGRCTVLPSSLRMSLHSTFYEYVYVSILCLHFVHLIRNAGPSRNDQLSSTPSGGLSLEHRSSAEGCLLLTHSMVQSPSWEVNWFAASQEIPRISRNPKVHYRTHKRPPPVCILGQPSPVHIPTSHLLEIHPNIIPPSSPRSPQWSLSLRFPYQDPIHSPLLTHTRHMPSPSHSSRFYPPHNIGWGGSLLLCQNLLFFWFTGDCQMFKTLLSLVHRGLSNVQDPSQLAQLQDTWVISGYRLPPNLGMFLLQL